MLNETAYAKVNLALHVRARRPDGYHELESLFVFCDDGDELTAEPRGDGILSLSIRGPFADGLGEGDDNLVLRAARALQATCATERGAALSLDKRLPIASGIGGGSADAAATLRLLARLWDVPEEVDLFALAAGLGADVPACLHSHTVFGSGVGEQLHSADVDVEGMPILLVNPLVACPTGPVFGQWDRIDRGPLTPALWRAGRNDLQAPALALVPRIADVLAVLGDLPGITLSRMSGSGATCFALFENAAARDVAEQAVRSSHADWWTLGSMLR